MLSKVWGVLGYLIDFPGRASGIWGVCVWGGVCARAGGETEARVMARLEPKHPESQGGTWRCGVGQVSSFICESRRLPL